MRAPFARLRHRWCFVAPSSRNAYGVTCYESRYGDTCSYADLARRVKAPGAQRAVGRANGMNRIAIVIPCHRVVNSDGKLGGYGGGLWRKHWLLELETIIRRGA